MTRAEMISAIRAIARPMLAPGYYVATDDGDPFPDAEFCYEHARAMAAMHRREAGVNAWIADLTSGADGHRECGVGGCNWHLDLGGLTREGVRSALGLTEEDPLNCAVYPTELVLAADAMMADDPHWRIWEHHAARALRRHRRKAA